MSTQAIDPSSAERTNTNKNIEPHLGLVKDGPLRGREVVLIPLDSPNALDSEIEKNKLLAKKESTKSDLWFAARIISLVIVAVISVLLTIFVAPPTIVILAVALGGSFAPFAANMLGFNPGHDHWVESKRYGAASKELEACKTNMTKNEFKEFTRDLGDRLPLDRLLKAHRLFERAQSMKDSEKNLQERKNILQAEMTELRREFLAQQV